MVHCDIIVSLLFSCRDLDQNVEIHRLKHKRLADLPKADLCQPKTRASSENREGCKLSSFICFEKSFLTLHH